MTEKLKPAELITAVDAAVTRVRTRALDVLLRCTPKGNRGCILDGTGCMRGRRSSRRPWGARRRGAVEAARARHRPVAWWGQASAER